ncbi:MAG: helix-turn-helix domain-containing protein [Candidatus Aminicenantes bacterium]|nr:MAG: helix-turn-helix domain-containing protein [Candidatus Aminicenantes bacterium]
MEEKFKELSIHKKMEIVIKEMVDKELLLRDAMEEFEKIYIETASKNYRGNKTAIAKALGVHRNTLNNRVKSLKISKRI